MIDQFYCLARPAALLGRLALASVFAVGLVACDTADYTVDWFDDDDEEETAAAEDGESEGGSEGGSQQPIDRPFPNLSSVPERPGPPEIKLEAVSVREGLTADKNNARYTDQALRSQTANVRPRPRVEKTADAPVTGSVGPTAADRATRPSAPPPAPPGTPAARRPPPPPPGSPAARQETAEPAKPAQPQVAARTPAVSPSSQPTRRPEPIQKKEPAPKAEPVARAAPAPAPAPEPVVQETAPRSARPAPPAAATVTAPAAPTPARQSPAPAPPPVRAGTTTLVATIYFADGQTALTAEDLAVLRQVMDIQRQGGGALRVVGHSSMSSGIVDPTRRRLVNFKVSLDRATIVARSFEDMGIPGERVAVEALGDAQPIYSEATAAGAAGNRRAEIFLDY